jgi:hypothetical protein
MTDDIQITCPKSPECLNCQCHHKRALTAFCSKLPKGWLGSIILTMDVHKLDVPAESTIILTWSADAGKGDAINAVSGQCSRRGRFRASFTARRRVVSPGPPRHSGQQLAGRDG